MTTPMDGRGDMPEMCSGCPWNPGRCADAGYCNPPQTASRVDRAALRNAATARLWDRRSMLPEFSEEIVDDVLDAILPLLPEASS